MNPDLQTELKKYFGFSSFRPGQEESIQSLLSGKHTVSVMPTGSGKSLIFQLAALYFPGITLVVSPLIALMKDQVDSLERHGISATFINSSINISEQNNRLRGVANNKFRIVYVAPERLRNSRFLEELKGIKVGLLAVDEAHCISEWGHDFRPDYLHIAKFRGEIGFPTTVALTATATPQVQSDISRLLKLDKPNLIVNGFNRPNLVLTVRHVLDLKHRYIVLRQALLSQPDGATIIYTGTRRDTEDVADFVSSELGLRANYYHAGLDNEKRTQIQNDFILKKISVIVATNAFGMGIDRQDVRQVIHFSMPGSLESYYQEAGRAGRDGKPAKALLLYHSGDRFLQEFFIRNSTISKEELLKIYNALNTNNHQEIVITGEKLSVLTELNEKKIRVGLSSLEQSGIVDRKGDEGSQMILKKNKWHEERIFQAVLRYNKLQSIKEKQLQSMIHYAESDLCRRKIILKYFGENSYVAVDVCCDNCIERKAIQKSSPVVKFSAELIDHSLIILEAIQQLKNGVGIVKIAQILQGSKNKEIIKSKLDTHPQYGKLSGITIGSIREMVGQLIREQYIKVIGGDFPILQLSHAGIKALQERKPIEIKPNNEIIEMKFSRKETDQTIPVSVEKTCKLIDQRKLIIKNTRNELDYIVKAGNDQNEEAISELIEFLNSKNGNHRRLAASALGKIRSPGATKPLMDLIRIEDKPQVKQYAIKALGAIGDRTALPLLEKIQIDPNEKGYVRKAAMIAKKLIYSKQKNRIHSNSSDDVLRERTSDESIKKFLLRDHPRQLLGSWDVGWSLGFHSRFQGSDWKRSPVGELAFRLKYLGDFSVVHLLILKIKELIQVHPKIAKVDAIIPVPSSVQREKDPVSTLAQGLSRQYKISYWPILLKSRKTEEQKKFQTLSQKKANVSGAFRLQSSIKGKRVLVVDDLFDSGATLEEITKLLKQAGADTVNVLTITRTIHSEH